MNVSRRWLPVVSAVIAVLALETAARVWVAVRWPPGMAYQFTHATTVRGAFAGDRVLLYVPAPSYRFGDHSHNSAGFRGPEFSHVRTAGVARIVIMGASVVYGPLVADDQTLSARLREALMAHGVRAEVINAGVTGWTSRETRLSFASRILPLLPDVIVMVEGHNDVAPQIFRNYRDDYGHFRNLEYDLMRTNLGWKRVFRASYLAMSLVHRTKAFGFDPEKEHPVYGSIRFENRPTVAEAESWVGAPERTRAYVENLRATVDAARAAGVRAVLATTPYRSGESYASNVLPSIEYEPVVGRGVAVNRELTRRLAGEMGVPLVDTPDLWTSAFMADDDHYNAAGFAAFAARLLDAVLPLVSPGDSVGRGRAAQKRRPN